MRRISGPTAEQDKYGLGKHGYRNGNKELGIPATILNAEVFNSNQEEICNVIEAAGLTIDPDDNTQLLKAMSIILSNADMGVRYTTTAAIVLNGLAAQGGGDWPAPLTGGDIILVKNQAAAATNGWYVAAVGAWTRVSYLDESSEIKAGMLTKVTQGATLADSIWMLTTDAPIVINTTALTYARKDQSLAKASSAEVSSGLDDAKYVTAAGLLAGLLGAGGNGNNDYVTLPYRDKTDGSRKNLIIQFQRVSTPAYTNVGSVAFTYPIAFPTAVLNIIVTSRKVLNLIAVYESPVPTVNGATLSLNTREAGSSQPTAEAYVLSIGY